MIGNPRFLQQKTDDVIRCIEQAVMCSEEFATDDNTETNRPNSPTNRGNPNYNNNFKKGYGYRGGNRNRPRYDNRGQQREGNGAGQAANGADNSTKPGTVTTTNQSNDRRLVPKNNTCYQCQKTGHFAANCPERPPPPGGWTRERQTFALLGDSQCIQDKPKG